MVIDPDIDFYTGTDNQTPLNKSNLVNVVLHEIGHGIGFTSATHFTTNSKNETILTYDFGLVEGKTPVFLVDYFIKDSEGRNVLDFELDGETNAGLEEFATSGDLYWEGVYGKGIKMFAPNEYVSGQSLSHLDEDVYKDSEDHVLTPVIDNYLEHAIGPNIINMLKDLGWIDPVTGLNDEDLEDVIVEYIEGGKSIHVKLASPSTVEFQLLDGLGKKVLQTNDSVISLEGLSKGIYYIQVFTDAQRFSQKVLVN